MSEYELMEVRRGHFAKVVDGKIVGMASEGDVVTHRLRKRLPKVEPALVEIALALSALFALLASLDWPIILRTLSGVGFILSMAAAMGILWAYLITRIPLVWTCFHESRLKRRVRKLSLETWLLFYYPVLVVRWLYLTPRVSSRGALSPEQGIEIAYVTLYLVVTIAGLILAVWAFAWPLFESI